MTNEEAILQLQQRLLDDKAQEFKEGCHCYYSVMKDVDEVAIKALEKQIPKKVLIAKDGEYKGKMCPACRELLNEAQEKFLTPCKCGQMLLWE